MTRFADGDSSLPKREADRMFDGSEAFPFLWRHFMRHSRLRDWLMRATPSAGAAMTPSHVAQGIAFCCNFVVPPHFADLASSFDIGEMFIPDHAYSHFMCGSVVSATPLHKHLVCALGPDASRSHSCMLSYQTSVRRMVVDMGSSRSINIMEFSWMQNGELIVTAKILAPPDPTFPYQAAGCTGAFAVFSSVLPGGPPPLVPRSLISFIEVPRCQFCSARGSLGCYCTGSLATRGTRIDDQYSSAIWPLQIEHDVEGTSIDSYHTISSRLAQIHHVAHVKVTAHEIVARSSREVGPSDAYELGQCHFVIKAVHFRSSTAHEADTLRQAADKFRLLSTGSLRPRALSLDYRGQGAGAGRSRGLYDSGTKSSDQPAVIHCSLDTPVSNAQDEVASGVVQDDPLSPVVRPPEPPHLTVGKTSPLSSATSGMGTVCKLCGMHSCDGVCLSVNVSPAALHSLPNSLGVHSDSDEEVGSRLTEMPPLDSTPLRRLLCPRCDKTFSQQGSLNRHLMNIHDALKIPCDHCCMSFGQMFDLKRHQRRKHPGKYSAHSSSPEHLQLGTEQSGVSAIAAGPDIEARASGCQTAIYYFVAIQREKSRR